MSTRGFRWLQTRSYCLQRKNIVLLIHLIPLSHILEAMASWITEERISTDITICSVYQDAVSMY